MTSVMMTQHYKYRLDYYYYYFNAFPLIAATETYAMTVGLPLCGLLLHCDLNK